MCTTITITLNEKATGHTDKDLQGLTSELDLHNIIIYVL